MRRHLWAVTVPRGAGAELLPSGRCPCHCRSASSAGERAAAAFLSSRAAFWQPLRRKQRGAYKKGHQSKFGYSYLLLRHKTGPKTPVDLFRIYV